MSDADERAQTPGEASIKSRRGSWITDVTVVKGGTRMVEVLEECGWLDDVLSDCPHLGPAIELMTA